MSDTTWPINIVVYGKAAPAGSKTSFIATSNDIAERLAAAATPAETKAILGGLRSHVRDANPRAEPWKNEVGWEARRQYRGPLLECALDMEIVFVKTRPKAHFGTGRNSHILKDDAPLYPTGAPDTLKLARGVEDALTDVVYKDDAQIVNQWHQKRYGEESRVEIRIRPTALTSVRDLLLVGEERPGVPTTMVGGYEQLALIA